MLFNNRPPGERGQLEIEAFVTGLAVDSAFDCVRNRQLRRFFLSAPLDLSRKQPNPRCLRRYAALRATSTGNWVLAMRFASVYMCLSCSMSVNNSRTRSMYLGSSARNRLA